MSNEFYALLDKYGNAPEPLSNWITEDLIRLMEAIDAELQERAPPDGGYTVPWETLGEIDGNIAE